MIASLPMYAAPRVAAANAAFWSLIKDALRARGVAAPETLTLDGDVWRHWQAPHLVLSQTCGLPYRARLHDRVTLVATPDYGLPDCPPGYYFSYVVARTDDAASLSAYTGRRFAYNVALSQSGWAALALDAPEVLSGPLVETGSHRASVLAVRGGKADFAAIDAVTWFHLIAACEATGLQIIHQTAPTPGLPFIAGPECDGDLMRAAVAEAVDALPKARAATLRLSGLTQIPASTYLKQPLPPAPAELGVLHDPV